MHRFNSPPGWPRPPAPDWQPPKGWQPDTSWPAAPAGWRFWTNERGGRSLGPPGAYGATSRAPLVAAGSVAAVVLVIGFASLGADGSSFGTPGATATTTVTVTTVQKVAQPRTTVRVTVAGPPVRVTVRPPRATVTVVRPAPVVPTTDVVYYANCAEARAAGDTPLFVGDPGYAGHLDRDKDGVACE